MDKKQFLFYSILFAFLFACGNEKKDKVIDIHDIIPQSERDYVKKETIEKESTFGFNKLVADSIGIQVMEIDSIGEAFFVDRFSPRTIKKLHLQLQADALLYCQWTFKDSTKTKNALYNWIDCYGANCKSIHFGEKVNFQKDNFRIFMNDTSITYISSALKLKTNDWLHYLKSVHGIEDWKLVIEQSARGKAKWFSVIEDKIEELKLAQ